MINSYGTSYLADDSVESSIKYLPRGLIATLLRPFPWERPTSTPMLLAQAESLAWYALYVAAAVGAVVGFRRVLSVALYPTLLIGFVSAVAAVSQGNLGTAFRHRGQFGWALALLASIAFDWWTERRAAPAIASPAA